MRKAWIIILIVLLTGIPVLLSAQVNNPETETDWDDYHYELYSPGDQSFIISLGVVFPIAFLGKGGDISKIDPPIGGTGSLNLNYYITSSVFIGAEIAGMFLPVINGETLFIIPLGIKFGTQFILDRFEFPISGAIGVSWRNFQDEGYFGLYMKAGGSVFFRTTTYWAFGLSSNLYWFPEFRADNNIHGLFLDLTLGARYHF
ncbi:MAG: hypothetical protein FWD24_08010 [Treponema sp.]|nr:hypothetical protein [Treponema sp.]